MLLLVLCFSFEGGEERDAVGLFGNWLFYNLTHGGEDVPEGADVIAAGASFDDSRPAGEHGRANAGFVHITLHTTKTTGGVPEIRLVAAFSMSAVVRSENDERVVADLVVLEEREDVADLIIEIFHHGGKARNRVDDIGCFFIGSRSILADGPVELRKDLAPFCVEFFRCVHRGMRHCGRDVTEERLLRFRVAFDELHRVVHDDVVNVGSFLEWDLLPVVDVGGGVVSVSDALAFPADKLVEAVCEGILLSFFVGPPKPPLSVGSGVVSGCLEDFGKDRHFRVKWSDLLLGDISA